MVYMLTGECLSFAKGAACSPRNMLKRRGFNKATSILFFGLLFAGSNQVILNKSGFFLL